MGLVRESGGAGNSGLVPLFLCVVSLGEVNLKTVIVLREACVRVAAVSVLQLESINLITSAQFLV
jgi:hypothetical protein